MAMKLDPDKLQEYLKYPIQTPPPGVTPDFVHPSSNAYQVYITAGVCILLMLVFACIRFISKFSLNNKLIVVEEVVFVLGFSFCLIFIALTIACVSGSAFGRHAWDVLLGSFTKSQLVFALLVEVILPLAICFVKLSVLILYHRVFGVLRWMRVCCVISAVIIAIWHISLTTAFAVMCSPRSGTAQIDYLSAFISDRCTQTRILVVLQGIGNVVTDLFLLFFPLPAIWSLHMPVKRKLAISSMFLVGLSACAASIVGLYYRTLYYRANQDNIRLVVPLWTTSMAEEAAGVLICCMPPTAVFFRAVKGPVWSWLSSTSSRALRLTKSSRSEFPPFESSSSQLHGSDRLKNTYSQDSGRSQNPIYCHPGSRDRHSAWVATDNGSHSLQQIELGTNKIEKRTDYQVSHT